MIGTEINIKEASDLLTNGSCLCVKKPVSETDVDNMLQHVVVAPNKRQKWEKINVSENIVEECMKQIEASSSGLSRHISHSQSNLNPPSSVPETSGNQIGRFSLGENHGVTLDMIFNGTESNHLGLASGETSHIETDTNLMDWDCFCPEEACAIPEDTTVPETNRTQVGLVPGETSSAALDNVAPPENNTNEMGVVPYEEGNDMPIGELISFDYIYDKDLEASLENNDSSQRDVPLTTSCIGHDLDFTPTTSQHQNIVAANHLDDDSDQNLD